MCGIAGIYHFGNSRPVDETALRSLCNAIKHRGPDDEGIYLTPQIGLGMRRLAVIDLVTGHQPLCNEDKTVWIVFNGEIYNYRQLREQLAPRHTFSTQSDTEVIIHLYEEYGESCVEHLRGMFAFAIWDSRRQCLFFARDRIGKKPLYYAVNNGALVFSSEIPGIIKYLPHKPAIKPSAIDLYLTYQYIPAPHTVFEGISTLLPAHTMTCGRNGEIVTRRYWDIDYRQKTSLSFPEACDRTYDLLRESTRLRMVADVPLGAFLSGGHDSSIIVGLMSQLSSAPVKTFSIGFDESDFSELAYARMVADRFKT
ncbi:MAG: asparagine synthase (glutamine-hydrolyzing), partial [Elusimicrobiota bacterium]